MTKIQCLFLGFEQRYKIAWFIIQGCSQTMNFIDDLKPRSKEQILNIDISAFQKFLIKKNKAE